MVTEQINGSKGSAFSLLSGFSALRRIRGVATGRSWRSWSRGVEVGAQLELGRPCDGAGGIGAPPHTRAPTKWKRNEEEDYKNLNFF